MNCENTNGTEDVIIPVVSQFKQFFRLISKLLKLRYNLHSICISSVHNSPHSMFHSFHGLMNSINWPACHCMGLPSSDDRALQRTNVEATDSNPVGAPKSSFFFGLI